jgi:hypothetical protein
VNDVPQRVAKHPNGEQDQRAALGNRRPAPAISGPFPRRRLIA